MPSSATLQTPSSPQIHNLPLDYFYSATLAPFYSALDREFPKSQEVKSDSRYVRFVIAKHSIEQILETGLPMEALEKSRRNGTGTAQLAIFSGPVSRGNTAKSRAFSRI